MRGLLLDPRTGRPGEEARVENELARDRALSRAPQHVLRYLERAGELKGRQEPRASNNGWEEVLFCDYAAGAQILNTTTETAMIAAAKIPTIPAAGPGSWQVGKAIKWTLLFDISFVITTPGTVTFRQRQNTTGGTAMAASGAYAPDPTAAQTTRSGRLELITVCRSVGATGTTITMGSVWISDFDDASATALQGNLNMTLIPTNAPATVTTDTTAALTLLPTAQFSVATATTQLTNHIAILESLN
jgi:hypothetical protein